MPQAEQQARLTRLRRLATGLLVLMCVLLLAARLLQARQPWLAYVAAFAEAAIVGALADWFAVVALFHHPLGLPIPHTAIVPRNQARIAANIAGFLEQNFLTPQVLDAELARFDPAGACARWLARRANRRALAGELSAALPALLRLLDDAAAERQLGAAAAAALARLPLAPLLARVLTVLTANGQHWLLLERLLAIVGGALEQNRPYIRRKVHENSPRWLPRAVDEKLFERLMEGVHQVLLEVRQEDSEWRQRFQLATEELIARLASSPDYEARLQALLADSLDHPLLRQYASQLWQEARQRLLRAASEAPGQPQLRAALEAGLRLLGRTVREDATLRARLNEAMRSGAATAIVGRRQQIAAVARRVIGGWDPATVARKFELQVGSDLQYIRLNGTIVGGLIGLLLHLLTRLLA